MALIMVNGQSNTRGRRVSIAAWGSVFNAETCDRLDAG